VCAEILYREGFTWDVAFFTHSRTYFAALAVFHSFLALKERRTQHLTKTLYMARRRRRILSFTVTEGAELQRAAGGTVRVHWRLWFLAAEPHTAEQFWPSSQITNGTNGSRSSLQLMMCISRLIQLFDCFLALEMCLAEPRRWMKFDVCSAARRLNWQQRQGPTCRQPIRGAITVFAPPPPP
jgi:hypothetical protein